MDEVEAVTRLLVTGATGFVGGHRTNGEAMSEQIIKQAIGVLRGTLKEDREREAPPQEAIDAALTLIETTLLNLQRLADCAEAYIERTA